MPVNLSATEVAIAIVARNDANEQEQVERVAASHAAGVMAEGPCPSTPPPWRPDQLEPVGKSA